MAQQNKQSQFQQPSPRTTIISVVLFMLVAFFVGQQFLNMSSAGAKPTDRLITSEFVQAVEHPNFKLLCDYYHLIVEGGTPEMAAACGDALRHVHIANPDGRVAMKPGDKADYKAFFDALRRAGYDARVSFEGNASDYEAELPAVLEVLKKA